jgi:hypothetical protein
MSAVYQAAEPTPYLGGDPILTFWVGSIPIAFVCLTAGLRAYGITKKTKKGSMEADVISYDIICFFIISYLSYWGWIIWYGYGGAMDMLREGGTFQGSALVRDRLLTPMACFQLYNFIACVYIVDFRDYLAWAHHLITMTIACFAMSPCWQYYSVFFFGCTETSTLPLIIVEVFKLIPRYRDKFPNVNTASRILFAASFLVVRLVWLPKICFEFFIAVYSMLPTVSWGMYFAFIICLIIDIFMVGLQYYWGFGIFKFVMSSFTNSSADPAAAVDNKSEYGAIPSADLELGGVLHLDP